MVSAPEVASAITSVATVANSTTRFADTTHRFADTIETFRGDIDRIRRETVEQVEQATARQRDAAIRQATTQFSAQRDLTVQQLAAAFRTGQVDTAGSLKLVVDQGLDRFHRHTIVLLCLAFAAAVIYRLIFRRSAPAHTTPPPAKQDEPRDDSIHIVERERSFARTP